MQKEYKIGGYSFTADDVRNVNEMLKKPENEKYFSNSELHKGVKNDITREKINNAWKSLSEER
jgi:hypothetical protein